MFVRQISVFLENKPGKLAVVTNVLFENNIDISAISIADTSQFGIVRMIVNDPEKAASVIKEAGFPVSMTEVLAVEVSDSPGGLNEVLRVFENGEISVEYVYSFLKRNADKALILFKVDNPEKAIQILKDSGFKLYSNG
ncbi:MAG: acetolactate synthase [Thermoanaerobacterales bacterium]|nr:acetolactate synthase [Thermoanaerobacterales bacterium]